MSGVALWLTIALAWFGGVFTLAAYVVWLAGDRPRALLGAAAAVVALVVVVLAVTA